MLKSSLCDYSDACILAANNANKKATFKNCHTYTDCISEIHNP